MSRQGDEIIRLWWMYCLLWPLAALLFLYNFIRSSMTRKIKWRGINYEMRSAEETVVIAEKFVLTAPVGRK
jgi:hypothetical protein